ncbi:MAG: M64 family metallopeptidase [Rhodothermales bacterium]
MPIVDLFWARDRDVDIHVIAGAPSPDLRVGHLVLEKDDGTTDFAKNYLDTNADTTVTFTPRFKGVVAGNTVTGHGITFDTTTGVATLANALPSPRKSNFIVEVVARDAASGDEIDRDEIRYHVHQSITKLWLTPGRLTVRPYDTIRPTLSPYRFAVRAQFDDGTVGDLSGLPGLSWTPVGRVQGSGRLRINAGDNPGDTIPITVNLPAAVQADAAARSATANMVVAADWSPANPIDVSIVVGGGWPGTINPEVVPNVLFLGDGFGSTPADKTRFEGYVNSLVHFLKTNPVNHPYDVLSTSMNFWSAFIPSDQIGVSVRSEVYASGTTMRFVPPPKPVPASHTGRWTLEHLIYMAGLPVPTDDPSIAARTNAAIKAEWAAQVDPDPAPKVNDDLINRWRRLAKRTVINDVDTPLGVRVGAAMADSGDYKDIQLNRSDRIDRDNLDVLLRALRDPRGIPVQDLWAERADRTRPNNYDLVCILVPAPGRALNSDGYFFVSVIDALKVKPMAGTNALDLDYSTADLPAASDNERGRVLAHELTHSFGIGDEYGERLGPPVDPGGLDIDEKYGNLTLEADAKNAAGDFHGDEVKWNWHRVRNAGVLAAAIVDAGGGTFRLPLRLGHGYRFAKGDTVHLRFREYPKPLIKNPKLSAPLEVVDPAPTDSAIHVRVKAGAALPYPNLVDPANYIAEFPAGSVVYIPTPAPASVLSAAYPYAEMVAKNIKDYITQEKKPLTKEPADKDDDDVQAPIFKRNVNLPDCFSKNRPRIVGLYSGGKAYHKGLYHPTGSCVMRESHTDGMEFCAVCRYVLVDMIDPTRHAEIDRNYTLIYPQR